MKEKINFISKYSFEDFINKPINMIKFTWKESLIISGALFLPVAFLFGYAFSSFFNVFTTFNQRISYNMDYQHAYFKNYFLELMVPYISLVLVLILSKLIYAFVEVAISYKTFKTAKNEGIKFKDLLFFSLKSNYLKGILQAFAKSALNIGIFFQFAFIITIIIFFITKSTGFDFSSLISFTLIIMLVFLLYLLLIAFFIYLNISFLFSFQGIVFDNLSPLTGLSKSYNLVKKNWWRVFGITFLITLIFSFSISIITSPVVFIFIIPVYIKLIQNFMNNNADFQNYFYIYDYLSKIGFAFGISFWINGVCRSVFFPVYKSLFYIDLKVRKNELKPAGGKKSNPGLRTKIKKINA